MNRIFGNECRRMFRAMECRAALCLGCGIAFWHFWQNVYQVEMMGHGLPESLYASWIGAGSHAMQSYWYYLILPLLAVMPYGGAFFDDLHSGYARSLLLRCSRKTYFRARGMAVFFSGGFSVTVPLLLNFLLTAAQRPAAGPFPYIGIGPVSYCVGADFYYAHPLIYTGIYLMFDFAAGGILALSAALLGYVVNYRAAALLIPYGIYYLLFSLGNILDTIVYSPNYFLIPGMGIRKMDSIFLTAATAVAVTALYWHKGVRYEA